MLHTYLAVPAFPVTSAIPDVSRPSLKRLARWIRDDLEILVAREGPGALCPDDVVTLHEHFVALRRSTTITARDLRATGIHKAVKEVAGIATRWPGRLCDECDKIITVWTDKFGPLDNLPPLLYDRGGRLEGIGSFNESTTEALLDRWRKVCPDNIDPKVSHRQGSLGFIPGAWWINPLFAHHAGIIGIESIDGGTTYDERGAYALLLNDTGEVDTRDEHNFSYRCSISDKGRFRLTAATVRSRQPIRVLRNHSRTSVWGPKAGIRYEGLYSVKGWIIRQATPKDIASGWKEGDIVYEVSLERAGTILLDDVIRRPTNMEMDDYIEYRRLRSAQQEPTHTEPGTAQPLASARLPVNTVVPPQSLLRTLPRDPHKTTLQEVSSDDSGELQDPFSAAIAQTLTPGNDLWYQQAKPTPSDGDSPVPIQVYPPSQSTDKTELNTQSHTPVPSSGSSNRDELKAIIPWIELEPELLSSSPASVQGEAERQMTGQTAGGLGAKAAELNPVKKVRSPAIYARKESAASSRSQKQLAASALRLITAKPILGASRKTTEELDKGVSLKKVAFGKKARFFDGTGYSADEENEYQNPTSKTRRFRSSSMDDMPKLHSPTPIRPTRPHSLFNYGIEDIEFTSPLDSIISRPGMAPQVNSLVSSPVMVTRSDKTIGQDVALRRLRRWLSK